MNRSLVAILAAFSLSACQCGEEKSDTASTRGAASETTPSEPTERPKHVGIVRGVVRLAEGAELPSYVAAEMGSDRRGEGCSPATPADLQPVKLAEGNALAGLMVSATGNPRTFFEHFPEHAPVEHRAAIEDCRLTPRLLVAHRGDRILVQNKTESVMFPATPRASFADSVTFGSSRTFELERAGVESILCTVPPNCGRTDVIVVMNPVFTATGEDGRFELTNVPADQDVTIHAWHPLFSEARTETRVAENGEVTVELVITPRVGVPGETPAAGSAPAQGAATPTPGAPTPTPTPGIPTPTN